MGRVGGVLVGGVGAWVCALRGDGESKSERGQGEDKAKTKTKMSKRRREKAKEEEESKNEAEQRKTTRRVEQRGQQPSPALMNGSGDFLMGLEFGYRLIGSGLGRPNYLNRLESVSNRLICAGGVGVITTAPV